jgi:hypothetical protein
MLHFVQHLTYNDSYIVNNFSFTMQEYVDIYQIGYVWDVCDIGGCITVEERMENSGWRDQKQMNVIWYHEMLAT